MWLNEGATVEVSAVLQGGSQPDEGWVIPVTVKFFSPGANVLSDTLLYSSNQTTIKTNGTAAANVTGIAAGTYDITVVSEHTLLNVKRDVVITTPFTAADMGTLKEGDANGDGIIDLVDFSILSFSYKTGPGDGGYDARANFDRNGIIDLTDFSILSSNYKVESPVVIP